jgi:hypothetical protein
MVSWYTAKELHKAEVMDQVTLREFDRHMQREINGCERDGS